MVEVVIVAVIDDDRGHGSGEAWEKPRGGARGVTGDAAVAIEAGHDGRRLRDAVAGLV